MNAAGSSPPARGLRGADRVSSARCRLIPACAGTTCWRIVSETALQAHPRLRGDYLGRHPQLEIVGGSSPPARGLQCIASLRVSKCGLIPACAGTTGIHVGLPLANVGSSPPARGLLAFFVGSEAPPRLIPACAGTTRSFAP